MNTRNDFELKQRKYMPVFPRASGKPTIYIEGYLYEDDDPYQQANFTGCRCRVYLTSSYDIFRDR